MDSISSNIDSINVEMISEIQRELDPYDVISLVFLLYDTPHTALERLTILLRVGKKDLDELDDWAKQAKSRATWKYEFLEALSICQLFGIIKKLGFDVKTVKLQFHPNNINVNMYINAMKKVLYKMCENMTSVNFMKLKSTLSTYNIDVKEYEACELVLLKLMCSKFITMKTNLENNADIQCNLEPLACIIESLSDMKHWALSIRDTEKRINPIIEEPSESEPEIYENPIGKDEYHESFEELGDLCMNVPVVLPKLKTDASKMAKGAYRIINRERIGVCYIINQEKFHPSKQSIDMKGEPLEDRIGSMYDKNMLKSTMESFNFKVIINENLTYDQIPSRLKDVVKYQVLNDDSVFMLCILSHGIEGCIYSSDSIPLKVKDLQNILDDAHNLNGKPKVLIIQACQGSIEHPVKLVADGPMTNKHIRKVDFLVYWATVPEYLAYRCEEKGTIFIQILCRKIKEFGANEHLLDIFNKINESVISICAERKCLQVPECKTTLRKKLFLKFPDE